MGWYAPELAFAYERKLDSWSFTNIDPQSYWLNPFLLDVLDKT
jgi:hypothetical protein